MEILQKSPNSDFDTSFDFFNEIGKTEEFSSVWSIYEVDDMEEVPYPDMKTLVYTEHWGEEGVGIEFEVAPTWLELWRAADHLILESEDLHHVFIEAFTDTGDGVYVLWTGS